MTMLGIILKPIIVGLSFYIGTRLLSGVTKLSFIQSLIFAVIIFVLNLTLGTVIKVATLGIMSLGIFNWLLNAVLIQVASWFLGGFKVNNFWWALALAAVTSITGGLLDNFIPDVIAGATQ